MCAERTERAPPSRSSGAFNAKVHFVKQVTLQFRRKAAAIHAKIFNSRVAADLMNCLFGTGEQCHCEAPAMQTCNSDYCNAAKFWDRRMLQRLVRQYPFALDDAEMQRGSSYIKSHALGRGTFLRVVFLRLCSLASVQIKETTMVCTCAVFSHENFMCFTPN